MLKKGRRQEDAQRLYLLDWWSVCQFLLFKFENFQCFLWKSIIILTNTNRGCSILLCQMTNMSRFHFDFAFLWLLSNLIRLLYHLQFTILQSNIRNSGSIYSAFQVPGSSQCKSSKQILWKVLYISSSLIWWTSGSSYYQTKHIKQNLEMLFCVSPHKYFRVN